MRKNVIKAYDDYITGVTPVYTSPELNSMLGAFDQMSVQVVTDNVSGTTPKISIAVEESNDGRNWGTRAGIGLTNETLVTTATNNDAFSDAGTVPAGAFIRFKITLGTTAPAAHVCITVCQRDDS